LLLGPVFWRAPEEAETMTDDDFAQRFEDCTFPIADFRHRDHVRLAWVYLRWHPPLEALARFTTALQRFATFHGHAGLYHETITWAYLFLIHERVADSTHDEPWEEFAARHPDLVTWKPSILDRYYDSETLRSDRARRLFVLPSPTPEPATR
jgi:hypothetical protein